MRGNGRSPKTMDVLDTVIDLALGHPDLEDYLHAVLVELCSVLDVDTASVLLNDPGQRILRVRAAVGIEEEVNQGVTVPLGAGFAGRVAERRLPVVLERVDATTVVNPLLWRTGLQTMAGVPLLARDDLVGVLHVGVRGPRRFTRDDVDLLSSVGDRVALVVQAEVSHTQRAAATLLQQSLLPTNFPQVPGFTFDARYVPGAGNTVGGDWYDVFPLPGDRLGIAIGDVAGHGLTADLPIGLGLRADRPRHQVSIDLPRQSVLAFYTDGLVEHRTAPLDTGLADLTAAMTCAPPQAVSAHLMDTLVGNRPHGDDIALLVLGHHCASPVWG